MKTQITKQRTNVVGVQQSTVLQSPSTPVSSTVHSSRFQKRIHGSRLRARDSFSVFAMAAVAILATTLFTTATRAVAQETVLHSFTANGTDGYEPYASLVFDGNGNLYGTTTVGGTHAPYGTVFELTPSGGTWTEKILHNFNNNGTDGSNPYGSLVFDRNGNLYGTTYIGGAYNGGTVFELSRVGGVWQEKILHSFNGNNGVDGAYPYCALILDASGNLYGTTTIGGTHHAGTVFELSPNGVVGWKEKILYSFNPYVGDGVSPDATLISDGVNLYGTTVRGGAYNVGTVFELKPTIGGWSESVLHTFDNNGTDGTYPAASLARDGAGNLYGTTLYGGAHNEGTVFELEHSAGWREQILHSFNNNGTDGYYPYANLILDPTGHLFGTTENGGSITRAFGTVYELTPAGGGRWTYNILHNFVDNNTDGFYPFGGLILDAAGSLFGTTFSGGSQGAESAGTVFQITR